MVRLASEERIHVSGPRPPRPLSAERQATRVKPRWKDDDKEGRTYEAYFRQADSYVRTNVGDERGEIAPAASRLICRLDLTPI